MKWILAVFLLLLGCALAAAGWFFFAIVHEPSYEQRSLSDWLVLYAQANRHFPRSHESDEAIRHIGPEALPYLLNWLQYEDSTWLKKCSAMLNKAPIGLRGPATNVSGWISEWQLLRDRRYGVAVWGFGILGTNAGPAVPALAALAVDKRPRIAMRGVRVLQDLGTNAAPAVPLLLRSLQNQNISTASSAAFALGCLQLEPNVVIPTLTNRVRGVDGKPIYSVVSALTKFGLKPGLFLTDSANQPSVAPRSYETNNVVGGIPNRLEFP